MRHFITLIPVHYQILATFEVSHHCQYEYYRFLGCDTVQSGRYVQTFGETGRKLL